MPFAKVYRLVINFAEEVEDPVADRKKCEEIASRIVEATGLTVLMEVIELQQAVSPGERPEVDINGPMQ